MEWTSQAATKRVVVPEGQLPGDVCAASRKLMPRGHESYVVRVSGRHGGLYWPRVSGLRRPNEPGEPHWPKTIWFPGSTQKFGNRYHAHCACGAEFTVVGVEDLVISFVNHATEKALEARGTQRCKHGVWLGDVCYTCVGEQGNEQLVTALKKYGWHLTNCTQMTGSSCSCGWDRAASTAEQYGRRIWWHSPDPAQVANSLEWTET